MQFWFQTLVTVGVLATLHQTSGFVKPPFIEFLFDLDHPLGEGYRVEAAESHFPAFAKAAKRICARGMWALYGAENFGLFSNTTVYTLHGRDIDCTTGSVENITAQINSLRPLGGLDTNTEACEYYDQPYFVGTATNCLTLTNFTLAKSMAIYMTTNHRVFCSTDTVQAPPNNSCVCLNGIESGSYLIPNTSRFPMEGPLEALISGSRTADAVACNTYRNPVVPFSFGLEISNHGNVEPL